MAYGLSILTKCTTLRCVRTARTRVYTKDGSPVADYCDSCADRKIAELTATEKLIEQRKQNGSTTV